MNERIGKLAEQAEEWVCKNYPDAMDDNDEFHAQTMAKFAELIVRECCLALWTEECHTSDLAFDEVKRNSKKIKEHFGVEE